MLALQESYRLLNLGPGATEQEIRRAYRDLARVWHPDRFAGDARLQRLAESHMAALNQAYESLLSAAAEATEEPAPPRAATRSSPDGAAYERTRGRVLRHRPLRSSRYGWAALCSCAATFALMFAGYQFYSLAAGLFSNTPLALSRPGTSFAIRPPDPAELRMRLVDGFGGALPFRSYGKSEVRPVTIPVPEPPDSPAASPRRKPSATGRPNTGALVAGVLSGTGQGHVTLRNRTSSDVVVQVGLTNSAPALVYVRAQEDVILSGFSTGEYVLFSTSGHDWNSRAQRFERDRVGPSWLTSLQFLQTASAQGVRADHYEVILKSANN
jgi:hypothetical protein